jgi:Holliday junction resolvasome RuvABC ATP-dependent DNA helicase subunit
VNDSDTITEELCRRAFANLEIDELGRADYRQILRTIIEKFKGGPVAFQPSPPQQAKKLRRSRTSTNHWSAPNRLSPAHPGRRMATEAAYKHLGSYDKEQDKLFEKNHGRKRSVF